MNKQSVLKLGLGLGFALKTVAASALPIVPTYGYFGTLPGVSFSGSGIPSDAVAVSTFSTTGVSLSLLTMGLSAAERCDVPTSICGAVVTNDGAGRFTAQSGAPFAGLATPQPNYASWNINYYVNGNTNLYNFRLLYDFNPAVGNDQSTHGVGNLFAFAGLSTNATVQDSANMGFTTLSTGFPGAVTPPSFLPFNPNVNGEYSFALIAFDKTSGAEVARSAIILSAVPEPEGYVLGLAGLLGLAVTARRRRSTH